MGRPLWLRSYVDRVLHTQYVREITEETGALNHLGRFCVDCPTNR